MDNLYIIIPSIIIAVIVIFLLIRHFIFASKFDQIQNHIENNNTNEAIKLLKKLIHKNDRNSTAHFYLGETYFREENYEWSLPHYKKVISINNYNSEITELKVRERLAEIYLHFNKLKEAQKEFLLILNMEPNNYKHYYRIGQIFYQRHYRENAGFYFKKSLEINPIHDDSLFYLGEILYITQRYPEALEYMKQCLKSNPTYHKAYYYIGMSNFMSKNYTRALKDFEISARDSEFRLRSLFQLGKTSVESGNIEKGILDLERAIQYITKEDKVTAALRYYLASTYESIRDISSAIVQWEIIANHYPAYKSVKTKLDAYGDIRMNDQLKDFMTASENRFGTISKQIVENFDYNIIKMKITNRGAIATILTNDKESEWRNVRKTKQLFKIYRISDKIGDNTIREILEEVKEMGAVKSFCITSSEFTRQANEYASTRPIELFDKNNISNLLSNQNNKIS